MIDGLEVGTRGSHHPRIAGDGTIDIIAGSLVAGIAAYAYQVLGGRSLGADGFAPVSVLLTAHFLAFVVVLLPIEQLVIRRLTLDPGARTVTPGATGLIVATTVGLFAFGWFGADRFFGGERGFAIVAAATVPAHAAFAFGRGRLAGSRAYRSYGVASGAASLLRLAVAVAVAVTVTSAIGLGWALVAGPLVILVFRSAWVTRDGSDEAPPHPEGALLGGLVLASASSQALLLAGPVAVAALGGSAVVVSSVFATFTLFRAPLTFGYNLIARVLPPFTDMAARQERERLRTWATGIVAAGIVAALAAGIAGAVAGPAVVGAAFGPDFRPDATLSALVAGGVAGAAAALMLGQILIAMGSSGRLAVAWMAAVCAAAAGMALPAHDPALRVAIVFVLGEATALTVLYGGVLSASATARSRWYPVAKRTLDVLVALVLALPAALVVAVAAVTVRLDSPGRALFRQPRVGRDGEVFAMWKLRTMRSDASSDVFSKHLADLDHDKRHQLEIGEDPRVTRVGQLLRRTSVDELPNLWNVLAGDMSLVGPRPLVPEEAAIVGLDHVRFSARPGITGLAQVEGREDISLEDRSRLDASYVANASVVGDLSILARTIVALFRHPGD